MSGKYGNAIGQLTSTLSERGLADEDRKVLDLALSRMLPSFEELSLPAVERLVQGDAPRDMVLRDGLAPQDLEPLLIGLSLSQQQALGGVIERLSPAQQVNFSDQLADILHKGPARARGQIGHADLSELCVVPDPGPLALDDGGLDHGLVVDGRVEGRIIDAEIDLSAELQRFLGC